MFRPEPTPQVFGFQPWRDFVSSSFLNLECRAERPASFQGSALLARFAGSHAMDVRVGASEVKRRQRDAENDARACFKAFWQLSGTSRVRQGVRESVLQPGHWTVYDTARDYAIESSDGSRFITLLLPQARSLHLAPAVRSLAAQPLAEGGTAHVARCALAGLLHDTTPLDDPGQAVIENSLLALLQQALATELKARGNGGAVAGRPSLEQVRHYIEEHLGDALLTPERVAQAFGISRRGLYTLFESAGQTPRAFIQQRRLDRAHELLCDATWSAVPVMRIARQCGFPDAANFSRAFHAHHGRTPSACRAQGARFGRG